MLAMLTFLASRRIPSLFLLIVLGALLAAGIWAKYRVKNRKAPPFVFVILGVISVMFIFLGAWLLLR